jgi:hypothetical protein
MTASRQTRPYRTRIAYAILGAVGLVLASWAALTLNRSFVTLNPGDDIQVAVDQYPEGAHFTLNPGVYRMQAIIPKDGNTFEGRDGAVLNGARLLTQFERQGAYWAATGATEDGQVRGECRETAPRCQYPEVIYLDGEPLRHAAAPDELEPGTFFFDHDADRVLLADDPTGRVVELSAARSAFAGQARNVTIRNLTIEKYANPAQIGAIYGVEGQNWTVTGNLVQLNHGVGIVVGDGMQVRNNRALRNGQMGITGIGANVLVEGNEIAYNNAAGFEPGWEAGGTKFVSTTDLVVRDNYVHDNDGPGIWTDIDNVGSLIEGNLVVANAMMGIFHEISYEATIRDNVVMLNSPNFDAWAYGAQIQISSSRDVEVKENRVVVSAEGGSGIVIVEQDRGEGSFGLRISTNNRVLENTIVFLGTAGQSGAATDWQTDTFWEERDNRFDANSYVVADASVDHWAWENRTMSWDEFRAHGQEPGGTLSTRVPANAGAAPTWTMPPASPGPLPASTWLTALAALGVLLAVMAALGLARTLRPRPSDGHETAAEPTI